MRDTFKKTIDDFEMDNYIDREKICEDFELATGDLPPDSFFKLESIFKDYIEINRDENLFRR